MTNFPLCRKIRISFLVISLCVCASASAHELQNNSAQVILRDGQLEIRLLVDREKWIKSLQNAQGWLTGQTNAFISPEMTGAEVTEATLKVLVNNTKVIVNQKILLLRLHKATQKSVDAGHSLTQYRLSSPHPFSNPESLSVTFPASLGDVYVSVVRPQYQQMNAGETHEFTF